MQHDPYITQLRLIDEAFDQDGGWNAVFNSEHENDAIKYMAFGNPTPKAEACYADELRPPCSKCSFFFKYPHSYLFGRCAAHETSGIEEVRVRARSTMCNDRRPCPSFAPNKQVEVSGFSKDPEYTIYDLLAMPSEPHPPFSKTRESRDSRCGSCRLFDPFNDQNDRGRCTFYPLRPLSERPFWVENAYDDTVLCTDGAYCAVYSPMDKTP